MQYYAIQRSPSLQHHGILGMKWGVRRYQPYTIGYQAKQTGKFIGKQKRAYAVKQTALDAPKIARGAAVGAAAPYAAAKVSKITVDLIEKAALKAGAVARQNAMLSGIGSTTIGTALGNLTVDAAAAAGAVAESTVRKTAVDMLETALGPKIASTIFSLAAANPAAIASAAVTGALIVATVAGVHLYTKHRIEAEKIASDAELGYKIANAEEIMNKEIQLIEEKNNNG